MPRRPIRPMPADLALKIAAGEVVERPSSAVKELIDNALDAGARTINVEVREGGLKLLRVTDDGCGIPADQLSLAFTSHATSKISTLEDLENLSTLGFRGEALPSVAAVSHVEARSRAAEDDVGGRIALEHGTVLEQSVCSAPIGLRITVSDLFGNVPARRKFVRSLRAESSQIQQVVQLYAMAQPGVQFALTVDGRATFHSPGTGLLLDALVAVHGTGLVDKLLLVDADEHEVRIEGMIGRPELSRSNRSGIVVFVNGRPVQNRSLGFALEAAYSGFLMTGRHPVAAVHLRVPPSDVDPNIHPSKSEVRFARDRDVHAVLHRAVAKALFEMRLEGRALESGAFVTTAKDAKTEDLLSPATPDRSDPEPLMPGVPALRVFGQSNGTFIIAEGPDGLYMIDQHAAHERVLFDRLDDQATGGIATSQPLLQPLAVDLTPPQLAALEECGEVLTCLGFELETFGTGACLVRAVPVVSRGDIADLVTEILGDLEVHPEPESARERALAMVACKAAVKAGQILDVQEMRELVAQLESTPRPATCPHGRPTMIHLSHAQLEREFGRR